MEESSFTSHINSAPEPRDFKGTGDHFPNSINHGNDGKRERDLMDGFLGIPVAMPTAIKANRSLVNFANISNPFLDISNPFLDISNPFL